MFEKPEITTGLVMTPSPYLGMNHEKNFHEISYFEFH